MAAGFYMGSVGMRLAVCRRAPGCGKFFSERSFSAKRSFSAGQRVFCRTELFCRSKGFRPNGAFLPVKVFLLNEVFSVGQSVFSGKHFYDYIKPIWPMGGQKIEFCAESMQNTVEIEYIYIKMSKLESVGAIIRAIGERDWCVFFCSMNFVFCRKHFDDIRKRRRV